MKRYMKKAAIIGMAALLLSCYGSEEEGQGPILASIGNYNLTLDEFESQLAEESEFNPDYVISNATKSEFLEQLIRKELLIQAAKSMKLDQRKAFIKTIERYWEATLIRDIMDIKGAEFEKKVYVTQDELDRAYQKMQADDPNAPPFEEIKDTIGTKLKYRKKQARFKQWVEELRNQADITIKEDLLE